ncbi:MAG: ATP-binding protein [Burkholderiales bacterium]|nr:ATP-binding protein [Burkholderiales bacterium]
MWIFRTLRLGVYREFIRTDSFLDDETAAAIGLAHWVNPVDRDFDAKAVRAELRVLHARVEARCAGARAPSRVSRNVAALGSLVGLSRVDRQILEFTVMLHTERLLDDVTGRLGPLSAERVPRIVAALLGLPERDVLEALHPNAVLANSGLVLLERDGPNALRYKLLLLSVHFAERLRSTVGDPVTLLSDAVSPSPAPDLSLADYPHVQQTLSILRPWLAHAAAHRSRGVNVLIYGIAGTGKTQLARVLAQDAGCTLFEVASADSDGDPVHGAQRLRALRAAQCLLSRRRALVLFDEVEDVFDDRGPGARSTGQSHKAWMNRTLEDNAAPTLWLSNAIRALDPAFIRRFDLVFELPLPPRAQRARIVEAACGDLLPAARVLQLADTPRLAPAIVTRAATVVNAIRSTLGETAAGDAVEHLISNTLLAQGHRKLTVDHGAPLPDLYDPAFANADSDIAALAAGLRHAKAGRLCLYGPPGTGKTAAAKWIAHELQRPLLLRRASDLINMYVGETERLIAEAFREAEREGAVLLIDEVDSFLQDRRGARRSWEVTAVNEMLTRMEAFEGIFIASTNLVDALDPAALRRFDLKLRFDYLKPAQAIELLVRAGDSLGLPAPDADDPVRLGRLRTLTPGDFAAVLRRARFHPFASITALVDALAAECALKATPSPPIGFL